MSNEDLDQPHVMSMCLGGCADQEHVLILTVQTLSSEAGQEESHYRRGTYPYRYCLSLTKEQEQLRRPRRNILRSHPLRRSQAIPGEAAPTTRAQSNSRADGSCLSHRFPQLFSREKAGLQAFTLKFQFLSIRLASDQADGEAMFRQSLGPRQ